MEIPEETIQSLSPQTGQTGLALSGGGFRAMLFHLGALVRINELGLLPRLERISSVSGGSIVAGRLAARWSHLSFDEKGVARNLRKEIIAPLEDFSKRVVDIPAVAIGMLPFIGPGDVTARFYRRFVTGRLTLQDLPDRPRFVFNASHLGTATAWRFSKPYMGTYRIGLIENPAVPLETVVAASAAFPPFLSPVVLRTDPGAFKKVPGADLYDNVALRRRVALTDGGVYDNLALQALQGPRFSTLMVSDASGGLTVKDGSFGFWGSQVMRALDTATSQARALRRSVLLDSRTAGTKVAFWRTFTNVAEYPAQTPFDVHPDWRHRLSAIPTRLTRFSSENRARLVNWGYLLADVAIRSYVETDSPAPTDVPYPHLGFDRPPAKAGAVVAEADRDEGVS